MFFLSARKTAFFRRKYPGKKEKNVSCANDRWVAVSKLLDRVAEYVFLECPKNSLQMKVPGEDKTHYLVSVNGLSISLTREDFLAIYF